MLLGVHYTLPMRYGICATARSDHGLCFDIGYGLELIAKLQWLRLE